jgi:hypothetical protein
MDGLCSNLWLEEELILLHIYSGYPYMPAHIYVELVPIFW